MRYYMGAAFERIGARLLTVGQMMLARPLLTYGTVVLLLVLILVLQPRVHIFTLDVVTEVTVFTTTDEILTAWDLGAASKLIVDSNPFAEPPPKARPLGPNAQLIIYKETQVEVQRHGTGVIRVRLTRDDEKPMARIETQSGVENLNNWAILLIEPAGTPVLFPFRGTLTVGYDVAAGVDSVLQGGTVSVVENQLLGGARYTANTEDLDPGDRVEMRDDARRNLLLKLMRKGESVDVQSKPATVTGFIRAEPEIGYAEAMDALGLVAHGTADFVQVDRLGSSGYKIRAPRWARFLHDPLLAAGTAIVALFALLMEVGSKCSDCVSAYREKKNSDKLEEADENA